MAIAEIPDNVGAAAVSMALSASGAVSSVKTTVLMTPAEAVEALRKSANLGYRPPGA